MRFFKRFKLASLLTIAIFTLSLYHVSAQNLADFSATSPTQGCAPHYVSFAVDVQATDQLYVWDFGDGSVDSSNGWYMTHYYSSGGSYDVSLYVYSAWTGALADSSVKPNYINISSKSFSALIYENPASCLGSSNGSIAVVPNGGTPPYEYSLNSGLFTNDSIFTGLAEGWYSVSAQDSFGCMSFDSAYVGTSITATITTTPDACGNPTQGSGSATITPSGGTGPYTYSIDGGATYQSSNIFDNLTAGMYNVLVKDVQGCEGLKDFFVPGGGTPLKVIFSTVDATCQSCANGEIHVAASGGTPPYLYTLDGGTSSSNGSFFQVLPGTHTVEVTDVNGCSIIETIPVGISCSVVLTANVTPAACNSSTGAIDLTVTGGGAPYQYLWSNGSTTEDQLNLVPGIYSVTVIDSSGCSEPAAFTVNDTSNLMVDLGPDTLLYCGAGPYTIIPRVTGGIPPYSYQWSTGSITASVTTTVSGTYSVTVIDANGCTADDAVNITYSTWGGPAVGVTDSIFIACTGDSVQFNAFGGTSYFWYPSTGVSDVTAASPMVAVPTQTITYAVDITVSSGGATCTSTYWLIIEPDDDCVWPGDANNDGVADNNDVLAIGVAYGYQGYVRPDASLVWEGQASYNWNATLANGANYKHVDCTGDALIDASDTIAVSTNYGLTHNKSGSNGTPADPPLIFQMPADSVMAGDEVQISILLGNSVNTAEDVYGIAFTVNYDNNVVEQVGALDVSSSWMGSNLLRMRKDFPLTGKTDIAISRTNHSNISGSGEIGVIKTTMKDDISGKDFVKQLANFSFSNVRLISNDETELQVYHSASELAVYQDVTGIKDDIELSAIVAYPNPAENILMVRMENAGSVESLQLVNMMGEEALIQNVTNEIESLDIGQLPNGVYLLTAKTPDSEQVVDRIAIMR